MNRRFWVMLALLLPIALFVPGRASAMAIVHPETVSMASLFENWIAQVPARRVDVAAFEAFLAENGVAGILPTQEILLTDTDWSSCRTGEPFILAARSDWPHILGTLRYLRDEIIPLIGPVRVVSGFRDTVLNRCAGGAPHSAHAGFYAFDLAPTGAVTRGALIAKMCTNHARFGASYHAGLGIYNGTQFHIDTRSFRRWGPDYRGVSSPCIRYEASLKTKKARTQLAKIAPRLRLAMLAD